jgi:hypothetical protein
MKKMLAGIGAAAAIVVGMMSSATAAKDPEIMLLHGIPGVEVDVAVDGAVVIPGFKPGAMQDLTSFAGKTLKNLEVRAAGTTTVVIGPVAEFAVPASGNLTVVAHLDASGKPTITPFANDIKATAAGQGRLTVRHTAAAPAVDIVLGADRPFKNVVNGKQGAADLPAGKIAGAKIAPTGADPIGDVPTVELKAGSNLVVYAVGSLADNTLTYYTQELTGLGGAPTVVNTGGEAPGQDNTLTIAALAGAFALLLAGGALVRRPAMVRK